MMQTPIPPIPPVPTPPGLDPNYVFNEIMPLIAVVTIIVVVFLGVRWIFRSPVGEALAQRIRDKGRRGVPGEDRVHELEDRVTVLQDHVNELAERVEFAERLLAGRREKERLPGGE